MMLGPPLHLPWQQVGSWPHRMQAGRTCYMPLLGHTRNATYPRNALPCLALLSPSYNLFFPGDGSRSLPACTKSLRGASCLVLCWLESPSLPPMRHPCFGRQSSCGKSATRAHPLHRHGGDSLHGVA